MEKRVRKARTLLVGTGAMFAGMLFAAGSAQATPDAPIATFTQGGDGYINMFEIASTAVKVDWEPSVANVRVRIVASACSAPGVSNATPSSDFQSHVVPGGPNTLAGSHTFTFDLSDAANVGREFPEGTSLCALVRSGYYQSDGSITYGQYKVSANSPVKDTFVAAGTVSITDPTSTDWLNLAESLNDPVGDPLGSIQGAWLGAGDSTLAQVWWQNATTPFGPLSADCGPFMSGPFPAVVGYSASSASNGGVTVDEPLKKACADLYAEGDEISFNAHWTDAAGNVSLVATTQPFPDGNLKVDRVIPADPTVDLLGASVAWKRPLDNSGPAYVTDDVINVGNQKNIGVNVGYTDGDIETIDVDVTDGATTVSQSREPQNNPQNFPGFNLSAMVNCSSTNNPPTHVPHAPLPAAPPRAADCITATAVLTDFAGNPSNSALDTGFKDAVRPTAPNFAWVPSLITDANDQLTEIEVSGEPYTEVFVKLSDEDPSSSHLSNYPISGHPTCAGPGSVNCADGLTDFRLDNSGFGAIDADVTTLADGTLTAEVYLTDAYGNESRYFDQFNVLRGFTTSTATKNLTTASLELTSPAQDSVNGAKVTFTGIAKYNNVACGGCRITIFDHPSNIPNYGNPANIALVTVTADPSGAFTATYTYVHSGTRRTFFRATNLADPADPINGRPSAVRRFDVDTKAPTVAMTTPSEKIYQPGEPVVLTGVALDDFAGVAGVELYLYKVDPFAALTALQQNRPPSGSTYVTTIYGDQTNCSGCPGGRNVTWGYDFSSLPLGRYTVQAKAVDRANNGSTITQNWNFTKLGN